MKIEDARQTSPWQARAKATDGAEQLAPTVLCVGVGHVAIAPVIVEPWVATLWPDGRIFGDGARPASR
jgi:hypothetical protein